LLVVVVLTSNNLAVYTFQPAFKDAAEVRKEKPAIEAVEHESKEPAVTAVPRKHPNLERPARPENPKPNEPDTAAPGLLARTKKLIHQIGLFDASPKRSNVPVNEVPVEGPKR
jgi:hypothetical protein